MKWTKIFLFIFFLVLGFLFAFVVNADAAQKYCKGITLTGAPYKYLRPAGAVCPNWKYIKCVVDGKTIWVIGGIKGEAFTNKCPISVSHTQP